MRQSTGDGRHEARRPPQRVMNDYAMRDRVQEVRRQESDIKRFSEATYNAQQEKEHASATKAFAEEEHRRKHVTIDPVAVETLRRLGGTVGTPTRRGEQDGAVSPVVDWKSPVKGVGSKAPSGGVTASGLNSSSSPAPDAASTRAFLRAIGVVDPPTSPKPNNAPPVASTSPSHRASLGQPTSPAHRETSPQRSHEQHRQQHHALQRAGALGPAKLDHSRAPLRTMVGHCKSLRTLMKTRPLAPIPDQPQLANTTVPERGSDVNADRMLSKFKLLQAEERDYATDLHSREIAEDKEGTLLHFEMTQSIRRVEEIVAALERGREYRDVIAYKNAREDASRNEHANQAAHEEASLEELRQVIQILLKDSSKQATIHQRLEVEARRSALDLKDAQDCVAKRDKDIAELQTQLDELLRDRESLKKEKLRLETQLELVQEQAQQAALQAQDSADPLAATPSTDNESVATPVGEPARIRKPLDGMTMLKELAPTMPSSANIPTGDDVTVVCTAVQSISRLWEQCAQDMPTAIALHNRIVLEEIPKHNGYQVKTAGEEFMVAFHTTVAAVNFAMTVQEQLVLQVWPQQLAKESCCAVVRKEVSDDAPADHSPGDLWRGLRVSMGIHCGPVHVEMNPVTNGFDYMGPTVNRALLLKRVSHGGMAAVSKEVYTRLNSELTSLGNDSPQGKSHSISYAETLRRRTSGKNLKNLKQEQLSRGAPPLCTITMAFHCKIPAARSAGSDVYCVLPMALEDRLADIQAVNKSMAEAHGMSFEDALQATDEEDQPSELETMLGTFSRRQGKRALFLTGEGVEDAGALLTDEEVEHVALQQAALPSGVVTLLTVQCEATRNKRFLEKILAKDMELLLQKFHDSIDLASAPFGAKLVDCRGDVHTYAFTSVGVAVRCALAVDAELTTQEWPKWIDNYKETEEVRWHKDARLFAGLRPSMGIHTARMQPHYDPMTKVVAYIGADAFVAHRLASLAKPGQTLLEETVAYQALGMVRPRPMFSHMTPNASSSAGANTVASRLCVVISRCYVGRHFYWAGMEKYELCKSLQFKAQYKRMKMNLATEDIRWKRDATRVVAREHVSGGITATTKEGGPQKSETAENDAEHDETGAETLLGLGEQFEAVVKKAEGTITQAMELRQRDLEVINIFCTTLLEKLNSEGLPEILRDREPIIGQLEKLEHNLMVLHDVFYEGQLVAFQPFIADVSEIRELPLKGTSRDNVVSESGGASTTRKRGTNDGDDWTDAEEDDDDEEGKEGGEQEDDDEAAFIASAAASQAVLGKLGADGHKTALEEELKKRLIVLEEEVFLAHRIVRSMFTVLKEWMEPLLQSNARYIMPDDEVVSKLIAVDRSTREPYLKQKVAHATAVAAATSLQNPIGAPPSALTAAMPKTTRQLWRHIVEHAVMDNGLEERMRGKGSKLLKSMESLVCRHFLFLRQYVKRVRMKERGGHGVK